MDPDSPKEKARPDTKVETSGSPKDPGASILSDPRYQGLYLADLRITWPGAHPSSIYRGAEDDLETIYPEELSAALVEMAAEKAELSTFGKPDGLSKEELSRRAETIRNLEKLSRLIGLHERRARGGHMALAERLGRSWPERLSSLGRLLFLVETASEDLDSAASALDEAKKPSETLKSNLLESLLSVRSLLGDLEHLKASPDPAALSGEAASSDKALLPSGAISLPGAAANSKPALQDSAANLDDADKSLPAALPGTADIPSPQAPSTKRNPRALINEAKRLSSILKAWRTAALEALVSCEARLFNWRNLNEAPESAPEALIVPPAPTKRLDGAAPLKGPANEGQARQRLWIMAALTLAVVAITLIASLSGPSDPPEPFRLHVYNGLETTVSVEIGPDRHELPAGGLVSTVISPEADIKIASSTPENLIEVFEGKPISLAAPKSQSGGGNSPADPDGDIDRLPELVYNVGGGAPLVEWVAVYAKDGAGGLAQETFLGAPTFLATRADFVLAVPPKTIKIKGSDSSRTVLSALSGAHPDQMLDAVPLESRIGLIETHARWGNPDSLWTPTWLDRLVKTSPRALEVLAARLEDHPLEPLANELFASLAPPDEALAWCQSLMGLMTEVAEIPAAASPDPDRLGDEGFLSVLCLPPTERPPALEKLLELHSEHPWLNRAYGFELFRQDQHSRALALLEKALDADPASMAADLTTLARLKHYLGADLTLTAIDLWPLDPSLSHLAHRAPLSHGEPTPMDIDREDAAFSLLEAGRLDEALSLTSSTELADKLIILAAGAPFAPSELADKAMKIPLERIIAAQAPWTALGLAVKTGQNAETIAALVIEAAKDPNGPALDAAEAVKNKRADLLPPLYQGLDPWFQGQVCLAAWLAMGETAPSDCPAKAAGFLFPGERPPLDRKDYSPAELASLEQPISEFSDSELSDFELSNSDIQGSEFSDSELSSPKPSGTEPSNSYPSNSELQDSELSDSELLNLEPSDAEPSKSKPSNSEPSNSKPSYSELQDSEPSDSMLSKPKFAVATQPSQDLAIPELAISEDWKADGASTGASSSDNASTGASPVASRTETLPTPSQAGSQNDSRSTEDKIDEEAEAKKDSN